MQEINVSINEVRETANQVRIYNKEIEAILESIQSFVNQSDMFWQSQASSSFRTKFNGLRSTFDSYCHILNEFALYLDKTCDQYEINESTLTQNINAF